MHLSQWKAGYTNAFATASNNVVPPLSSAPGARPSWRGDERCNILERNTNYHLIHNKVMQYMPSEQNTYTKVWPPATQNSNKHSMGGFMCPHNQPVHAQRLGWICNRFHGTHHDQPHLELVWNSGVTASHLTIHQDGQRYRESKQRTNLRQVI